MMIPTIHMNGTSAASLQEGYADAYTAIGRAIETLAAAGPNGRDYYPQGPDAYEKARTEHDTRITALRNVQAELEALCEGIDAQAKR